MLTTKAAATPIELGLPVVSTQFDGNKAYQYLEAICSLGPRVTGSAAMKQQQELLTRHFKALGASVESQTFTITQPSMKGATLPAANLIVRWNPESKHRVLLGAHYDTRPYADQDPIFRNRTSPFLGANDGASGVAFLMELGRLMPNLPRNVGVDFVLFDAEEYILSQDNDDYFLGSEEFVRQYLRSHPTYQYNKVVVVDMIADKDLVIYQDERSSVRAGALMKEVFGIAGELGLRQFVPQVRYDVLDDHVSFQSEGIPAIVLIDFDYPYWHRTSDTPDKCSGESLELVSRVIIEWIKRQP